jgi:hypothetical protein
LQVISARLLLVLCCGVDVWISADCGTEAAMLRVLTHLLMDSLHASNTALRKALFRDRAFETPTMSWGRFQKQMIATE